MDDQFLRVNAPPEAVRWQPHPLVVSVAVILAVIHAYGGLHLDVYIDHWHLVVDLLR